MKTALFHTRALGLCLTAALSGCSWFYGDRASVRVSLNQEPLTLDAVAAQDPASQWLVSQLQRGLTLVNAEGVAVGDLSEGWSQDVSGRRYTFVLAPSKWSDGVDLKAADFVFAWQRHKGSPNSPAKGALEKVESVRSVSDRVLEVVLEQPDPKFPAKIATALLGPQRADVVENHPQDHSDPLHLRSIGVYQPTRWSPGQQLTLATNSYYPHAPVVPRVELVFNEALKDVSLWVDFPSGAFRINNDRIALAPHGALGPNLKGLQLK